MKTLWRSEISVCVMVAVLLQGCATARGGQYKNYAKQRAATESKGKRTAF